MNDPKVIVRAPNVSDLLGSALGCDEGLSDRARGVMLGLAAGNLLGLPVEGWGYGEIDREYPNGVVDVDPREVCCPMDDDLAQAVELSEALLKGGDYVGEFGERLVDWARENGRGIGITTSRVISALEAGHRPPKAARIVYEESPIAPNGGVMRCAPVALARFRQPELLVSDSAATCVVTHYATASQWSCIIINAVIALLLRGAEPDLCALMAAASSDGCPALHDAALRDGIPSEVLASIVGGGPVIRGRFVVAERPAADRSYADCDAGRSVGSGHSVGVRVGVAAGGGGRGRYGHQRSGSRSGSGRAIWGVGYTRAMAGRYPADGVVSRVWPTDWWAW